jgi:hypothetical protein
MLSNPLLAFPSSKIGFFIISALFCYVLVAMSCRRPGGVNRELIGETGKV